MYRQLMNNKKFIGRFAIWSISIACLHFVLETLFTLRFGQAFVGLVPDYIAVALLIWGGLQVRRNNAALGLLCGAWGFTFCLHYRAWAWRFEEVTTGQRNAGGRDNNVRADLYRTDLYYLVHHYADALHANCAKPR